MKKIFIAGFAALMLVVPMSAGAQSLQSLQAQLNAMLAQLAKLQAQVEQQNASQTNMPSSVVKATTNVGCQFTRNLYAGLTGGDVTCLQGYLIEEGFLHVSATGYFGGATQEGVRRWQGANGVSTVGTFGPVSRATYSKLVANASNKPSDDSVATAAPRCSITANKSSYKLGETIKVSWTSQNATYAAFKQDVSGKDHLKLPGDKLATSGSQTLTADVTGNPDVTLFVYNAKGSGSCKVIVPVTSASMTSIQVTYPQEGFVLDNSGAKDSGIIANIQWNQQNGNHPVSIYLLDTGNQVVRTIATRIRDTGTYRWKYDSSLPAGKYQIRVDVLYPADASGQDNAYSGYFTLFSAVTTASIDQTTLRAVPGFAFTLSGEISAINGSLTVAIVGPSFSGNSDWSNVGNLLKGDATYTTVSQTVYASGSSWSAQFGSIADEGYYTVLIYDGSYNLVGSGTLWVTYKG